VGKLKDYLWTILVRRIRRQVGRLLAIQTVSLALVVSGELPLSTDG
jgi:hypothetical protein